MTADRIIRRSKLKYSRKQKVFGFILGALVFLVIIPLTLVVVSFTYMKTNFYILPRPYNFILAFIFAIFGILFVVWAGFTQLMVGKGTPVPITPTKKLISSGPYTFCRNPMFLGCINYYIGICILFNSLISFVVVLIIIVVGIFYIKVFEEKELEARFGNEYIKYKENTPFLFPFKLNLKRK